MRILIAEDDPTSRLVLEAVLTQRGHEVVVTADGEAAWTVLTAEGAPKLAILDWMMPGIDGVELCRRLRAKASEDPVYVILLTALGSKEAIVAGLETGANDYVTKPFDKNELGARVRVGERMIELQTALVRRVAELHEALRHVKTLQGILPICMFCHKIRTDQETWQRIDTYLSVHTDAEFTHGCCEECLEKHYPEIFDKT